MNVLHSALLDTINQLVNNALLALALAPSAIQLQEPVSHVWLVPT